MDQDGISPIHHENFDWTTFTGADNGQSKVIKVGGIYYKKGHRLGNEEDKKVTALLALQRDERTITNSSADTTKANYTQLAGLRRSAALSIQR